MDPTIANAPTPALFRFSIHTATATTHIEHTHPVPLFLCQPAPSQQTSSAYASAFVDVLSIITAQHHAQCMTLLASSPCAACFGPATDCLKAPSSFLHLVSPLAVVAVYPVCGSRPCEAAVRARILQQQKGAIEAGKENERKIYAKMKCAVCGKADAKRCAGCGTVGYCGKECQAAGWKGHRRHCVSKKKREEVLAGLDLPYEAI